MPDADRDPDTGPVAERDVSDFEPERTRPVPIADAAAVVQPVIGLLHLDRRQFAGPVPVADRVSRTRPDANRLSGGQQRPGHAVPDADAEADTFAVGLARVPDARRRRQRRAVPVADRVPVRRSDAKRLPDRRQRPKHAVPDADADTHAGPVTTAVPHQHERPNAALPNAETRLEEADPQKG
jgi:hypothetical protein